jgi:hypothetical protein
MIDREIGSGNFSNVELHSTIIVLGSLTTALTSDMQQIYSSKIHYLLTNQAYAMNRMRSSASLSDDCELDDDDFDAGVGIGAGPDAVAGAEMHFCSL